MLPSGVSCRMLLLGCLLGFESERGIALRVEDSLALRQFPGCALNEPPPDHDARVAQRRDGTPDRGH